MFNLSNYGGKYFILNSTEDYGEKITKNTSNICSSLLSNFIKSVHKDGDHTVPRTRTVNEKCISNAVIDRVNKIRIDNTFIYNNYE